MLSLCCCCALLIELDAGSGKDGTDDRSHHVPHRGQEAARSLCCHRAAIDIDELDLGREHDLVQGKSDSAHDVAERAPHEPISSSANDVRV